MSDSFRTRVQGAVAQVTLTRPGHGNRLTREGALALTEAVRGWAADTAIGALVLRGAADADRSPVFCAGLDLDELGDPAAAAALLAATFDLLLALSSWRRPMVAIVNGLAVGTGLGLALTADLVVVTERARLNVLENGIGPTLGAGVALGLSRSPGGTGLIAALTGSALGAADALYLGLATHHVRLEQVQQLVSTLFGADMGADAPAVVAGLVTDFSESLPASSLQAVRDVIDVAGAQASLAHVLASLHLVNSQWSLAAAAAIRARSPVAQAVIHRLLEGLDEAAPEAVLAAERGVMERFLAHPDFATGLARARGSEVGAEWNPGRIEQVKPADVEAILGPAAKGPAAAGASS